MSESSSDLGVRPVAAKAFEPATRFPSPTPAGVVGRSVLFPEADPEDEPHAPHQPRRFQRFRRPVAYVASAVAGAVLVTAIYGLIGPRPGASGARAGSDSARAGSTINDTAALGPRADTPALALSAFGLRGRIVGTRRLLLPRLAQRPRQGAGG